MLPGIQPQPSRRESIIAAPKPHSRSRRVFHVKFGNPAGIIVLAEVVRLVVDPVQPRLGDRGIVESRR